MRKRLVVPVWLDTGLRWVFLAILSLFLAVCLKKGVALRSLSWGQWLFQLALFSVPVWLSVIALVLNPLRRVLFFLATGVFALLLYFAQEVILIKNYVAYTDSGKKRAYEACARAQGRSFDTRTAFEILADARSKGQNLVPAIYPSDLQDGFVKFEVEGKPELIFGSLARARTLYCNESGTYSIYESDEMGFNNPTGIWQAPNLNWLLLGDSFVQGACVEPNETIAAFLRAERPSVLALGLSSSGPLSYLGMLKEFTPVLKPRAVVWVHYEGNDIVDLERESNSPLFTRYLDPRFEPSMIQRLGVVQQALPSLIERKTEASFELSRKANLLRDYLAQRAPLAHSLKLVPLRENLGLTPTLEDEWNDTEAFEKALKEAARVAHARGAKFYFVYLPSWRALHQRRDHRTRRNVMAIANRVADKVADVLPAFSVYEPREELFVCDRWGHYSPKGYLQAAKAILAQLP